MPKKQKEKKKRWLTDESFIAVSCGTTKDSCLLCADVNVLQTDFNLITKIYFYVKINCEKFVSKYFFFLRIL